MSPSLRFGYMRLVGWSCLLAGFFTSSSLVAVLAAEITTQDHEPINTAYRRVFVPADTPEDWPVGSERFLPISRDEFSRLIKQNQSQAVRQQPLPIHVNMATYRAELRGDTLLSGIAEWSVEIPAKQSKLLPLAPMNLAILSARWQRKPGEKAAVGLWKRSHAFPTLAVLVEQSDTLLMQWELAARESDSESATFYFKSPIVVPQTLELLLPANHWATLTDAEPVQTDAGPLGESQWIFQLGPSETHRLRIYRKITEPANRILPLVSQTTSYQLEPSGLKVRAQIRLDARDSQITELSAVLTSGLRVVEAKIDQQPVNWRVIDDDGSSILVLQRPESQQPQSIEVRCLAKIQADSSWVLPKLQFKEVAWTEGTTSLLVSPELKLRSLTPRQATLQHIVGITDPYREGEDFSHEGEVFRLQEWSEEAEIEVEVGRPRPSLTVQTVTTIDLRRDETQASIVADFSSSGGDIYQVQAAIAAGWTIDTVMTTPKFALNEWHFDREAKPSKLLIQLNQPISEHASLRIAMKARESRGKAVLPATVGGLKLIQFRNANTRQEFLQFRTSQSKQLVLSDRLERTRLAPDDIAELAPSQFRSLLSELAAKFSTGTLLDASAFDESEVLEFRHQPAQYTAKLLLEINASSESFEHRYQIDCQLQSGAVSKLELQFDAPLPENVQWKLTGQRGIVSMQRIHPSSGESLQDNVANYLLRLPVAIADDFRLEASYEQPAQPTERCNLIRLPLAIDWTGQVLLRGSLDGFLVLDQGWTPTISSSSFSSSVRPEGARVEEAALPVLGTYRLGPEEFRRQDTTAGLRLLRQTSASSAPQLVAWLAEYHTLQAANGAAIHTASYCLERLGATDAQIVLPAGAELLEAWLDSLQIQQTPITSDGNTYQFQLESGQHWPRLTLKYSTRGPALGVSASLQPVVPECSFPVNLGRWTLWAPEQFEIENSQHHDSSQNDFLQRWRWWKRLFGPLARTRDETVFNPLDHSSWHDSWTQLWPGQQAGQPTKQLDEIRKSRSKDSAEISPWLASPLTEIPLWDFASQTTLAGIGRRAQTLEFVERIPTLVVRKAYVQRALWYALLLLSIVLGVWQLAHYPNVTIFICAVAGAGCLVIPSRWLTLPQSVLLGLIAAAIVRVSIKTSRSRNERSHARRNLARSATIALLICLLFFSHSSQAQPPNTANTTSVKGQNLPRVLVPIDSEGKRQGEDVYLPARFLDKLQRPSQQTVNDGAEFVILAANYSGRISRDLKETESEDRRNLTEPWTLRWKVESFLPNCRLSLPLRREEATWIEGSHRLDGLPVQLDWQPDGRGCAVVLPETGVHWLQIVAMPRFTTDEHSSTLRLHVPPLSGATLDVELAPTVAQLLVLGAGRTRIRDSASDPGSDPEGRWQGSLGAMETVELNWISITERNGTSAWEKLEQLSWLRIDPASARLEVQLLVTGYQASSRLVEIDVSPQLKLEPPEQNSPIEEVNLLSPTRVQLKLRPKLPADFIIPLRFELQRSSSVGRIFFPKVNVRGALRGSHANQSLFAVSVSAGLSYNEQGSSNLRIIRPDDFATSWGTPNEEPLYAYSLGQNDPSWSLRVWPDPQSFSAQQSLRIHCQPSAVRVDYEAVIDKLTGAQLSHRLVVPKSLQIDRITVQDLVESNSVPVHWNRLGPKEAEAFPEIFLEIFLGQPLRNTHLLQLQGHVDQTNNGELELPNIRLLKSERGEMHMDLYRSEDVQVSWTTPHQAPQETPLEGIPRYKDELYFGHFSWKPSRTDELSKLRLERNDQVFETKSVTTLESAPTGWQARLNSQISVRQGVVSRLSLSAPVGFQPPYDLQPAQIGVIEEVLKTPSGKNIIVLLAQSATSGDEIEVQLGGYLSLPADQRLEFPSLQWNGAVKQDRYLLLPTLIDGQSLEWQTSGLRRQALPRQLSLFAPDREAVLPFQLEHGQFEAKERTFRGNLSNAQVRHANISGLLDGDGLLTAIAEIILQPGRASSCAIQLPPESQLLQLIVGGLPVRRDLREDGGWELPLGPPFMPQKITVNYRTKSEMGRGSLRLVPPKILLGDQALPLPRIWWRVRTTQDLLLGKPLVGNLVNEFQFAKNNYLQHVHVLEDALSQALDLPHEEGNAWAEVWQSLTEQVLRNWQSFDFSEPKALVSTAQASEEETQRAFLEAFPRDNTTSGERFASISSSVTYPPRLPAQPNGLPANQEHFLVSDSQGQLIIVLSRSAQAGLWRWLAASAMVCGALAVALRLRRYPSWHHELCQWPHCIALVGGCAWWLLLKPSAIGILVVALAFTSLMLKQWRFVRQRRKGTEKINTIRP